MYEVYMLNRPVVFSENANNTASDLVIHEPSKQNLIELPQLLRDGTHLTSVNLTSENPSALWMEFCMLYREVLAAGCVVVNNEKEYLWIERNSKWDLPKGKVESNESIEEAALREVTEETGIDRLTLVRQIGKTYHTYEEGGHPILKTTFWFLAQHNGGATPGAPQLEEGITAIHWEKHPLNPSARSKAYPSILHLVDQL